MIKSHKSRALHPEALLVPASPEKNSDRGEAYRNE